MIIFTLRRLLLLVTLFFLTFVGFSLSYFTPHAPAAGRLAVERLAVLVQRTVALGLRCLQH
ncbi:Peptide transport system permease protein sapB [Raoultella planticola]|uniref:Peptide transport system permease protein sapB n=1 Tax=Raoultella planticola TaxID=575 RepID=A0A485AKM2_RAOPL|nr:Peptide transport system permease protein sapB [Raoultella planticola]